jgi:hypothetical protein
MQLQDALTKEDWELIGKEGSKWMRFQKNDFIISEGERHNRIYQIGKGVLCFEFDSFSHF